METLKVIPHNKEQLNKITHILKALEIPFETEIESPYDQSFVSELKEGEKQMREGKKTRIRGEEELKRFLEID